MSEDNIAMLLECSLCFEQYDEEFHLPKGLPCYHTFCLECMQQLQSDRKPPRLKCPECRTQHTLPADGVKGLPSNVTITSLVELKSQSASSYLRGNNDLRKCLVKRTSELMKEVDEFSKMVRQRRQLNSRAELAKSEIQKSFKQLGEELKQREKELFAQIDSHVRNEIESLKTKQKTFHDKVSKIQNFNKDIPSGHIEETRLVELLKKCTDYGKIVSEMQESLSSEIKKVVYVESGKDILSAAQNGFGKVQVGQSRSSNASKASLKQADVNVNAPPVQSKPRRPNSIASIDPERYLEIASSSVEPRQLDRHRRNSSTSSSSQPFPPTIPNERQKIPPPPKTRDRRPSGNADAFQKRTAPGASAMLNLFNMELKQTINLKQRESTLKNKGEPSKVFGMGVLGVPHDVAVTQGKYFVVDSENHYVHVFNPSGQHLKMFGGKGMKKGQLMHPNGICTNSKGQILVVDATLFIQVYDSTGKPIDQMGICRTKRSQSFNYKSTGLDCDDVCNIYACDPDHYCIKVLDQRGVVIRDIGHHGWGDGEFKYPSSLTTFQDKLIVTDLLKHCIMVFEQSGKFFCSIGCEGIELGQMREPTGVAVDDYFLIVVDSGNHRLQVIDRAGKFITSFGGKGRESGKLEYPMGVVMTGGGNIVVCDSRNKRIQVF
ncbi:RING finger protein nhl-1-like [Anneissia japonica]|uniref:RING finger protein nhl-1-like n=1 Tax=Anneissia japonica TaxID=1529436 RepID=UPI00142584ED|nr:RING finger protein nhl-1-like [Anneissia japonica]XP_033126122.1 RING finger protein nhl-1-like [Anneissia japonica]XP_033126123.1 RING finger protein nhl-1-like [Anneissia japonica]